MAPNLGFFCPAGVDVVHAFVRRGIPREDEVLDYSYAYVRNIAYNLQYLEFLSHTLDEAELHVTVRTLSQKTFVITGMSVVEAVLWYVLKKAGHQRREEWEEVQEFSTQTFNQDGNDYRLINKLCRKLQLPIDAEMPLDAMIKRVESKKLLGIDLQVYKDLNYLRKLRNRVHIHAVQHDKDTDWWNFNNREVKLMKGVLRSVLCSQLFTPLPEHTALLGYLNVTESTEELAADLPF
jgi:hypothetical protein